MSRLADYEAKRTLNKTPEPKARKKRTSKKELVFVIQKHAASHLHYDLRLELDGVLKSWAVPKGMPKKSGEKRLAIMTEDHPFEYKDFEGVIPKGNYGAGVVEIWDSGTYLVPDADVLETKKTMRAGLKKGHVRFLLSGKRLSAEYSLIHTPREGAPNAWLVIKNDPQKTSKKKRDAFLKTVKPMLATLVDKPFDDEDWLFEIKWDGYRALAFIRSGKVRLISRNDKSFNQMFPNVVAALKKIKENVILDGEIVVINEQGKSEFQRMQRYQKIPDTSLLYYVFDLLYQDGEDLRELPLVERKERLELLLAPLKKTCIRYSDHVKKTGVRFFLEAKKHGLEGILAKNALSTYESGRSSNWLKIKTSMRQEMVIAGFTKPKGSRTHFGALLLGVYSEGELHYVGLVGTGFSHATLESLTKKFKPLIRKTNPFVDLPKKLDGATFLKPRLVGEISFTEWTKDGSLRHPTFLGLRVDKKAVEVKKERDWI